MPPWGVKKHVKPPDSGYGLIEVDYQCMDNIFTQVREEHGPSRADCSGPSDSEMGRFPKRNSNGNFLLLRFKISRRSNIKHTHYD